MKFVSVDVAKARTKKPRSLQDPMSWVTASIYQHSYPTGFTPGQWRLIAREPVNRMAIRFIVRELCALEYTITAIEGDRGDTRAKKYNDNWNDHFEMDGGFQAWMTRMIQDLCEIPFGAATETFHDKSGDLVWAVHVDAGTLLPTYVPKKPVVQVHPEDWLERVFFGAELKRLMINPRPELRYKEFQVAPTEDAYLEIEALSRIYLYYLQQLSDTPPPGILDLVDMSEDDAIDWATSFRELLEGIDTIKIPVLYEHEKPAVWIPFGRSPTDLNMIEQFKRFAEMLLAKYGLSIGDLRLFEHESTKAGERVSQMVTERSGIGFWASRFARFITHQLLPKGLRFEFKQPRPERELVVAQRKQVQLAMLQAAAGGKALITPENAIEQAKEWEILSVEVEVPEEEEPPAMLPGGNGQPTQEDLKAVEETRDQLNDTDLEKKGGPGSGNFGHSGRPGHRGGSAPRTSGVGVGKPKGGKKTKPALSLGGGGAYKKPVKKGWRYEEDDRVSDTLTSMSSRNPAEAIAERADVTTAQVEEVIEKWHETSNNDADSVRFQRAVEAELGVSLSKWQQGLDGADQTPSSEERRIARAMYDHTQEQLREAGYKSGDTVRLFRGFKSEGEISGTDSLNFEGNALESWTGSREVAQWFGQTRERVVMLVSDVPVERVFSMQGTGFGVVQEAEMVVLGGQGKVAAEVRWQD